MSYTGMIGETPSIQRTQKHNPSSARPAVKKKKLITRKPLTSAKCVIHQNVPLINTYTTVLEPGL